MARFYKQWLPPALVGMLRKILRRGIFFSGNYSDWSAAQSVAGGYDAENILEKVRYATLQVASGKAVFERDSVLFDKVQHSYPLLSGLLRAAAENQGSLSVLDIGGSLGSSYFQCRDFLSVLKEIQWSVVEQPHFVRCGRDCLETEQLRFYFEIDEALQSNRPNVVLLASVLQYLPEPNVMLRQLAQTGIPYLIIDRTPFSEAQKHVITVQHVPPEIYPASYPCWILSRKLILNVLEDQYEILAEFESFDGGAEAGGVSFAYGGMILCRK